MKPLNPIAALAAAAILIWAVAVSLVEKPVAPTMVSDPLENIDQPHYDAEGDGHSEMLYGAPRSSRWPTVRKHFLEKHGKCAVCGATERLEAHHRKSFKDRPDLELDPDNLEALCREHHFIFGHDPDGVDGPRKPNWKDSNPRLRRDIDNYHRRQRAKQEDEAWDNWQHWQRRRIQRKHGLAMAF